MSLHDEIEAMEERLYLQAVKRKSEHSSDRTAKRTLLIERQRIIDEINAEKAAAKSRLKQQRRMKRWYRKNRRRISEKNKGHDSAANVKHRWRLANDPEFKERQ